MDIFEKVKLLLAARATCKHKFLSSVTFANNLKIAPYVQDVLISYNRDVTAMLHNKKLPVYRVTRKGRIWRKSCNLAVGKEMTKETVKWLQSEILKQDIFTQKELERLQEQRIDGQTYKKHHLVQQCNDKEDQLMKAYATEVLERIKTIRKVISAQVVALTEMENRITDRFGRAMECIHRFYTMLPRFGCREQLRLPTVQELGQLVPLMVFPEEYRKYKEEMIEFCTKYEKLEEELRKKFGV